MSNTSSEESGNYIDLQTIMSGPLKKKDNPVYKCITKIAKIIMIIFILAIITTIILVSVLPSERCPDFNFIYVTHLRDSTRTTNNVEFSIYDNISKIYDVEENMVNNSLMYMFIPTQISFYKIYGPVGNSMLEFYSEQLNMTLTFNEGFYIVKSIIEIIVSTLTPNSKNINSISFNKNGTIVATINIPVLYNLPYIICSNINQTDPLNYGIFMTSIAYINKQKNQYV